MEDPWSYLDPTTVNLVLYHDKCPDGFGAAFVAWKVLGSNAEYVGCDHGLSSSYPPVQGKRIVILDFSFRFDVLTRMIGEAERLVIIDHHQTAEESLRDIPSRHKIFDMTKSGCILAWEFFFGKPHLAPPLLYYIQDRDLWHWRLRHSQEVCAGLDTYPQTFEQWDTFTAPDAIRHLKTQGEAVLRYRRNLVESIGSKSLEVMFSGVPCRCVNMCGGSVVSYVGHYLLEKYQVPLALMWY